VFGGVLAVFERTYFRESKPSGVRGRVMGGYLLRRERKTYRRNGEKEKGLSGYCLFYVASDGVARDITGERRCIVERGQLLSKTLFWGP